MPADGLNWIVSVFPLSRNCEPRSCIDVNVDVFSVAPIIVDSVRPLSSTSGPLPCDVVTSSSADVLNVNVTCAVACTAVDVPYGLHPVGLERELESITS